MSDLTYTELTYTELTYSESMEEKDTIMAQEKKQKLKENQKVS